MGDFTLLTIFIIGWIIVSPIYLFHRVKVTNEWVKKDKQLSFYTRDRIFKITLLQLLLVLCALSLLLWLLIAIKMRGNFSDFTQQEIIIVGSFLILCLVVAFGAGAYASSVITEQFTLNGLKQHPAFDTLLLVNEFYHGPVSHVLVHSSALVLLLLICFFEKFNPVAKIDILRFYLYIVYGIIFGLSVLFVFIRTQTWKHQMPVVLIANITQIVFLITAKISIYRIPFNAFFLCANSILSLGLIILFIHHKLKHTYYRYD
ncbi:MAG: hypothetical protein M1268_01440 [Patescibacteria group bacterium]|nr:hypothetical protein [Patescibacteria group bacterium]